MSGTPGGGVQTPAIPVPQGLPPLGLTMPGIQTPNPGPGGNMMGVAQAGGMQMVPMQPMAGGGGGGGGASISLGLLLEHLVQKTYHELTVLSEL